MDDDSRNTFDVLQQEYEAGNPQALLDALRLLALPPKAGWVHAALLEAMIRWTNGETREFAEPWGLTRPKGWRQAAHQRDNMPCPEHSFLSLRGAVLRRIAELIEAGVPRLADEYGGVFPRIAEEFKQHGVSSSLARKWWYNEANLLREPDSQKIQKT